MVVIPTITNKAASRLLNEKCRLFLQKQSAFSTLKIYRIKIIRFSS